MGGKSCEGMGYLEYGLLAVPREDLRRDLVLLVAPELLALEFNLGPGRMTIVS